MQKFREKLEGYLIDLEKELNAPEKYRIYVMKILDKTEKYGARELTDDEFERIKGIARQAYINALETSGHLSKIRESLDSSSRGLTDLANKLAGSLPELGRNLDELERACVTMQKNLSRLEDELKVLDALKYAGKGPKDIN